MAKYTTFAEPRAGAPGRRKTDGFPGLAGRLLAKISPEPNSGCWLWTGSTGRDGHGQISCNHKLLVAHRVSYELNVGAIPDGLVLDHLCRTPCCVNPAHLEPVTDRVNTLRGRSPAALSALRTECSHGHPFSGENLMVKDGRRRCRTCYMARNRRSNSRREAA